MPNAEFDSEPSSVSCGKKSPLRSVQPRVADALKPNGKPGLFGSAPDTVFVIDYLRLTQLPSVGEPPASATGKRPSDSNVPPDAKEQDIKQIREDMKKKDVEIENLKKEMEDIRRDMGKPSGKSP